MAIETAHKANPKHKHNGRVTKGRSGHGAGVNRILEHLPSTETIGELASTAAEGLTEQLTELKEKGMQASEAIDQRIIKNPKTSVLIAFGVGYLWARTRRWF
jgi:hypothetical protein